MQTTGTFPPRPHSITLVASAETWQPTPLWPWKIISPDHFQGHSYFLEELGWWGFFHKCYATEQGVGVKEVSRLISRVRHRQFGVLVTTSFVAAQAYQEIKDDKHPIAIISNRDIAEILSERGLGELSTLTDWLKQFED